MVKRPKRTLKTRLKETSPKSKGKIRTMKSPRARKLAHMARELRSLMLRARNLAAEIDKADAQARADRRQLDAQAERVREIIGAVGDHAPASGGKTGQAGSAAASPTGLPLWSPPGDNCAECGECDS